MTEAFANPVHFGVHAVAMSMVDRERIRQVREKGYTPEHDDEHTDEEIATAAAFYLLPNCANEQVVIPDGPIVDVRDVIAGATFEVRPFGYDLGDEEGVDARIDQVVTGAALAVAELERLLRIKESFKAEASPREEVAA